ncbi:M48 family metallopeptidase [Methanogenium cariaci]
MITLPGKQPTLVNHAADEYRVIVTRKPVRNARMRVMPDGTVRITAPKGFDTTAFVAEKTDWIAARQAEMNRMAAGCTTPADQMLLLGTGYTVREGDSCHTDHHQHVIIAPNPAALRAHLTADFRTLITASVTARAEEMGVSYGRCSIRMQKTRWGSCSSAGNLNMNLRLYALPIHLRDYVVVHELAHRKELNHSPAFWSEVAAYYPAYRNAEADLRRYWVAIERNHWWSALQEQNRGER